MSAEKAEVPLFEIASNATVPAEQIGLKFCSRCRRLVRKDLHAAEDCSKNIAEDVMNS